MVDKERESFRDLVVESGDGGMSCGRFISAGKMLKKSGRTSNGGRSEAFDLHSGGRTSSREGDIRLTVLERLLQFDRNGVERLSLRFVTASDRQYRSA